MNSSVEVGGQRLRVSVRDADGPPAGPPLVLCNGIGASLELLEPFVEALDPAIEVIRFDVPGSGGSPVPLLPYGFGQLAGLLAGLLDRLGHRRADVLGISWGGALAQQFALQYPQRCRRLVLVATGSGLLMVPAHPSVLAEMLTPRRYQDPIYRADVAPKLYGGGEDVATIQRLFARVLPGPQLGYVYQLLAIAAWTSLPFLPLLAAPTLLLAGDDDPLIPLANARLMHAAIPRSELHVYPGGHLRLLTHADELAPLVAGFLGVTETACLPAA